MSSEIIKMVPRVEKLEKKTLIGMSINMSLIDNKTRTLWSQFAPRIKEVSCRITEDKISMQIYPPDYYEKFAPEREFEKWAAVEVGDIEEIPPGMDTINIRAGLYAVFDYTGSSSDSSVFQYIFNVWFPKSKYVVDNRPHFEVLGSKYRNDDPASQEEIWIPIKEK